MCNEEIKLKENQNNEIIIDRIKKINELKKINKNEE